MELGSRGAAGPPGPCGLAKQRRASCGDLMATEFGMVDEGTVIQYSPSKHKPAGWAAHAGLMMPGALELGCAAEAAAPVAAPVLGGSPTAVAGGMAVAPSTSSQPSSATSSLAAALADLQVSSRQSSASDLGDRRAILAGLGLPAGLSPGPRLHSRCPSAEGELGALGSGGSAPAAGASCEAELCPPQLIGAVKSFDSLVLRTLTPIKTRSRTGTAASEARGEPSPAAPYADSLVSPFLSEGSSAASAGLKPKLQLGGSRPMIYHSRGSSAAAPGAYTPYDLTAAALSSEFRSPAKSLMGTSHTASTTVTPASQQWGSASYRAASYRALAAQQALAAQKDDEPDFYVSVPGVLRRQHSSLGNTPGTAAAAAAAVASAAMKQAGSGSSSGGSSAAADTGSGSSGGSQRRCSQDGQVLRSQGSGTAVHGFKGLFRNLVVGGSQPGTVRFEPAALQQQQQQHEQ